MEARTIIPTPEQVAVVEAAKGTEDNLLVSALAGAAKTSTLVMVADALPKVPMLCLAFNKRIQLEMEERLPGNCVAMTLNGLGHRRWKEFIGRNPVLDTRKGYGILKRLVDALPKRDKDEAYDVFSDLLQAVEWGKVQGYVPTGRFPNSKPILDDLAFFSILDEEPSALFERLVIEATIESIGQGLKGTIDFNDQILLPTIFPATFPQYPLVLVDEAQDLSTLNHVMLRKIAKKRLIAVGDERQSIYAFRGANEDSMSLLRSTFTMRDLTLSTSFRCPRSVVREALWRAPHMQFPEWAIEGSVEHLDEWNCDLPEGTAILCRNNAPLFSAAIRLLKDGRYPELVGNDIGKSLIKTLKKLGDTAMRQADVMVAIDKWAAKKKEKSRAPAKVDDQAECLRIFARQGERLSDALAYAEHILAVAGPIKLMTIHKSKGLEFPIVYLLDRHLIRTEGDVQEQNLLYVAQTRAKEALRYVGSEGYVGKADTHTVPGTTYTSAVAEPT